MVSGITLVFAIERECEIFILCGLLGPLSIEALVVFFWVLVTASQGWCEGRWVVWVVLRATQEERTGNWCGKPQKGTSCSYPKIRGPSIDPT